MFTLLRQLQICEWYIYCVLDRSVILNTIDLSGKFSYFWSQIKIEVYSSRDNGSPYNNRGRITKWVNLTALQVVVSVTLLIGVYLRISFELIYFLGVKTFLGCKKVRRLPSVTQRKRVWFYYVHNWWMI